MTFNPLALNMIDINQQMMQHKQSERHL